MDQCGGKNPTMGVLYCASERVYLKVSNIRVTMVFLFKESTYEEPFKIKLASRYSLFMNNS